MSAQGLSKTKAMDIMRVAAGDLNFQMRKVSHALVGGATQMEFWAFSGIIGDSISNIQRDPRPAAYARRATQFMDLASKQPRYKGGPSVEDPRELLTVRSDLRFRVRTKSVFIKGQKIIRELSNAEIAQLLDWRKELSHVIPGIRRVSQDTGSLPLPVRVPVAIVLGAMRWLYKELEPAYGIKTQTQKVLYDVAGEKTIASACPKGLDRSEKHGIKETSFYGHFVDPSDALEISVATRADDALVDTSQWAYGGCGAGMEEARETIRRFLHRCWLKRLATGAQAFIRDRSTSLRTGKLVRQRLEIVSRGQATLIGGSGLTGADYIFGGGLKIFGMKPEMVDPAIRKLCL
jgi:hypothetical protein